MTGPPAADIVPGQPADEVRVVGIGASAGGLVALEDFFAQVRADTGLAYVVVQHLDPTQKAVLAELLQRVTKVPVVEARAGMRLQAGHVYVIPPNTEISVSRGAVQLAAPAEPRGLRLPINVLFSSLAREQGALAIGVVLSGMGSDGTLGLQAIKAVGGLSLVQDPASAPFDSMPRAAIAAACVDIVAFPAEMAERIGAFVQRDARLPTVAAAAAAATPSAAAPPASALQHVLELLRRHTRHDFSLYKPSSLHRRLQRRMAIHGHATLAEYTDFARQNPQELDLLFKEILIGVTSFFRDPAVWQYVTDTALPALLAQRGERTQLRAWVAGCSTGEEAYTLAMVFAEVVQRLPEHRECHLQIFASDLSPDAIAIARAGSYPTAIKADLSAERLARFFVPRGGGHGVNKALRETVLFAQHDLVLDPPFTKLDILSCRNLLIYFDAALQRRLLPLFHYSLRPGGLLLLGSSETVGPFNRQFEAVSSKLRLYHRPQATAGNDASPMKSFPPLTRRRQETTVTTAHDPGRAADGAATLQAAADHVLLQVHAPPAVVVNAGGDIVYISGRTGHFLEPAAGKANWNFHAMVRDSLRAPVAAALPQALAQGAPVHLRGLPLRGLPLSVLQQPGAASAGPVPTVDITVQPLLEPAALRGMVMIVFREHPAPPQHRRSKGVSTIETAHAAEVQQLREEIQSLREQTQSSREELQSANEELQSTNEELQSTNEELTTSQEEMQSMNEELQTVNAEMQARLDDLALAQSDMKNLLNSTDIAMLFLDQQLNVRRYTDRATRIISLRDNDIGRPLSDLSNSLDYPAMCDDAQETLRSLQPCETQVTASEKRWFNVRVMPYRRLDNVVDGAVITFVDITQTKALEARLRADPPAS